MRGVARGETIGTVTLSLLTGRPGLGLGVTARCRLVERPLPTLASRDAALGIKVEKYGCSVTPSRSFFNSIGQKPISCQWLGRRESNPRHLRLAVVAFA